jgi:proteasome lid subunit RPN8/RPN11
VVVPQSQFLAQRDIRSRALDIVAVFHSHPDGSPFLSPEDIAFDAGQPWLQIVLAFPSHDPGTWQPGVWAVRERQAQAIAWKLDEDRPATTSESAASQAGTC